MISIWIAVACVALAFIFGFIVGSAGMYAAEYKALAEKDRRG